jgi:hypothetical protein
MIRRYIAPALSCASALAAVIFLVPLSTVHGQGPATAKVKAYTPPKTPWGDPDLQGIWPGTDLITVPLQRPANFGTRNVLTEEEFKQRQTKAETTAASDAEEFVPDNFKVGINPPGYWLDRGKPTRVASLVIDPPDGRIPAVTKEAQDRTKVRQDARKGRGPADSFEDRSLYDRCVSRGVMGSILPVIYNNGTHIVQTKDYVAIRYEMIHETRVIPLDGRPFTGSGIRSYMGDARGHWEGNTLVIETRNFLGDKNGINLNGGGNPPHSADMVLTERITRVSPDMIEWEATIDDPKTWTKPWKLMMPLKREDDYLVAEYACHEGNYALRDILSGARQDEINATAKQGSK